MRRQAINILNAVAILIVLWIIVVCCRTVRMYEILVIHGPQGRPLILGCNRGILYFAASNVPIQIFDSRWMHDERWPENAIEGLLNDTIINSDWQIGYQRLPGAGYPLAEPKWFGFSLAKGSNALNVPNTWYIFASLPAWFVGPLLAIFPLRRSFLFLRSRRRRRRGLCPVCAYDLRQSSERCPECGVAFTLNRLIR